MQTGVTMLATLVLMVGAGATVANGQGAAGGGVGSGAHEVIATGGLASSLLAAPVVGEPYSAVQTAETTETLPNGTKVTHHGHHRVARDAAGRVMVERRLRNAKDGQPEMAMFFVMDPVNHTLTTWMTGAGGSLAAGSQAAGSQVATVAKLKDANEGQRVGTGSPAGEAKAEDGRPQPVVTTADLGTRLIDNVTATGELKTTVVPAGRSGNDQPITKTHEVWTSEEMKLVLLQRWEDPRTGERVVQFADFSRAEPDAAIFHPPAGYTVQTVQQTLKELAERLNEAAAQE